MSNNFNDILADIKKIKTGVQVWVPSKKENVELKVLTLAQQKAIIESSADINLSVLFFNSTISKILEQNLPDKLTSYNTIDRVQFAIALRRQIKNEISIDGGNYLLEQVLAENKLRESYIAPKVIESTNYKFSVRVPNLEYDNRVNNLLLKRYKDESIRGNKLKSLISDLFVSELFKFIEKIEVQSSNNVLDLTANITQGLELIESIDSKEFVDIVTYINNVRAEEKKYT